VLAGGGVAGGGIIGQTDRSGSEVTDRPVTVPDLFATFCASLGIDPAIENMAASGRPIKLVDGGQPIRELL
jgi:arylsulfatase A-like enzyme